MIQHRSGAADLEQKRETLYLRLRQLGRLMVAYSGGADSAYLAYAAHQALGEEMLAVLADSPSLSRSHLRDAVAFAREAGIPLRVIETRELENADYARNDGARCFHCKDELFRAMSSIGAPLRFTTVAYGMNADDLGDFRPGQRAAEAHAVLAPLAEAGLNKEEIRSLARLAGLRIWDKPASACLSSRIAYGLPVTPETLETVEKGEEALAALGFREFRLRHHGDLARIEIAPAEIERMLSLSMFARAAAAMKLLGYKYVTLDLEGYRSGSMNAVLPVSAIARPGPGTAPAEERPR